MNLFMLDLWLLLSRSCLLIRCFPRCQWCCTRFSLHDYIHRWLCCTVQPVPNICPSPCHHHYFSHQSHSITRYLFMFISLIECDGRQIHILSSVGIAAQMIYSSANRYLNGTITNNIAEQLNRRAIDRTTNKSCLDGS